MIAAQMGSASGQEPHIYEKKWAVADQSPKSHSERR